MSEEFNLEQFTKDHEPLPEVPDQIWQNVRQHLPKKKRRPVILPFLLIGTVCLVVGYIWTTNGLNNEHTSIIPSNSFITIDSSASMNNEDMNHDRVESEKSKESYYIPTNQTSKNKVQPSFTLQPNQSKSNVLSDQNMIILNSDHSVESSVQHFHVSKFQPKYDQLNSPVVEMQLLKSKIIFDSNESIKLYKPDPKCYNFKKTRMVGFFVETYAGPSYSPMRLSNSDPDAQKVFELRKTSESARISAMAGIKVGVQFRKVSVRTGIEYLNMLERMEFSDQNYKKVEQIFVNGQLVRVDTITGERFVNIHNYHHHLSVPVSIGYTLSKGKNKVNIQLGVGVNFYSWHKGAVLDSVSRYAYFTTGKYPQSEIYNSNFGLSSFLSVQWEHKIRYRWSAFIEPAIQYYFSPINKNSYHIQQRYFNIHTKIGLKYYF